MEIASSKSPLCRLESHSRGPLQLWNCYTNVSCNNIFCNRRFQRMAEEAPRLVREKGQKIILGVDRLDYTKGLVHRLKAFERFLEKHPEHIEEVNLSLSQKKTWIESNVCGKYWLNLKVIFIQIAVPSRTDVKEYQDLKEEMDQVIGRINGRFSTANWSPIRYIYGCVSQVTPHLSATTRRHI